MASTTISGQYGFNGSVNVLSTLSAPAITLNGTDLQTTLTNLQTGETTLQTNLINGTVVPLTSTNSTNASRLAVTASSTTENVSYCIPFVTSSTGNVSCETASSDLLFNPSTRTTTIRNLNIYGSIGQNGNGVPTIYANDLNVATNGNLKLGSGAKITLSDGSTDLQTSLNSKVDTTSDQVIAGSKTFSGLATFNGGLSLPATATETDSGNLIVGGNFTANGDAKFTNPVYIQAPIQYGNLLSSSWKIDNTTFYIPNAFNTIVCSTATSNCYAVAPVNAVFPLNAKLYNRYNFVNTTYTATTAVLTMPPANIVYTGMEISFFQYGTQNPLALAVPSGGAFNISNSPFTSNYVLPANWYKISFVCLPDPTTSGFGTTYFWLQTHYQ